VPGFLHDLKQEAVALRARMQRRAILIHLALIGVFGILLPWWKGVDFLDAVMLSAYACLGILFAAPAAAEAFAQSQPKSLNEALARIAMAVIYAEFMTVAILGCGLITVYLKAHFFLAPDLEALAMSAVLGVAASVAMAAIAGWMTLRFSSGVARVALRIIFLGLLLLFFSRSRWLPDVAGIGVLLSLAVAAGAVVAIRRCLG
jgi:hypothetical protein